MKKDLVSVITPMYNGEKYIEKTINSVLKQTYPKWEMIIVDDGSEDSGAGIVEGYIKQDDRIRLIKQPNAGSAAARNNALRNAGGQYISFLDSDDLWDNEFLETQIKFLKEKSASIVFSSYRRIDEKGQRKLKPYIVPSEVTYYDLLKTCSISCLTVVYDKDVVGEHFFKEELRSLRDDFAFWLQMLKRVKIAYGNKKVLASYRVFKNSTTGSKKKVIKPQFLVYYRVEKLGLVKSVYYLIWWAINGFLKYR